MLRVLQSGTLEIVGRLPYASNATLLAKVSCDGVEGLAVYKPRRGEAPLWDFPDGTLCLRERAAWVMDDALGWGLVPPTVLRDGPAGFGAVQLYVDEDTSVDIDDLLESHEPDLRRIALFDAVVNNADRKAGHCLLDRDGRVWAIDHGVTFHAEPKLRTVIWAFGGDELADELVGDLVAFGDDPPDLSGLLVASEQRALLDRAGRLVRVRRYPQPPPGRRHVPWPPW